MKITDYILSNNVDPGVRDFLDNMQTAFNSGLMQLNKTSENPTGWKTASDGEMKAYFTGSSIDLYVYNASDTTWYNVKA